METFLRKRRAEASLTLGWEFCGEDELFGIFNCVEKRDENTMRTGIECTCFYLVLGGDAG
jgi:hypothetical protein